ncbi:cytochrome P450 [Penicillium malachiteum]|uniref:Cytochrome P450 n=1 Tax=Penicillium malachiteum TaxID=1324776 RepID=A0AAD6HLG3_9EURO|nr:cytochrome P450 [Penicillium malachiteum]
MIPLRSVNSSTRYVLRLGYFLSNEPYQKRLAAGQSSGCREPGFMERFIEPKGKFSDNVDDNMVIAYMLTNVAALAESDTTTSIMRLAVNYILRHSSASQRLWQDLQTASPSMPVQWKEMDPDSPYLEAVMREIMRRHLDRSECPHVVVAAHLFLPYTFANMYDHAIMNGDIFSQNEIFKFCE